MRIHIFLLALILSTSAFGTDIDDLSREIAANNPTVASRLESIRSDIFRDKAENTLDAPEIEIEHLFGERGVKNKTGISVSQNFDWPGVYRARSKSTRSRMEALRMLYISDIADIALEAKIKLLEIIYLKKRLALTDSINENIRRILADTERGFTLGVYTRLDINRLKIEKIEIDVRRNECLLRMDQLIADLSALNGGKSVRDLIAGLNSYPIERLASLEEYINLIRESDPTLAAAIATQEAAADDISSARLQRLPGWSIGYKFSREEGHNFNGFTIGMTLPFLTRNYKGLSAKSAAISSKYEYQATLVRLTTEATTLHAEVSRLGKAAAEYADVFEKSDNIRLLTKAYQGRQLSSVEYLNDINYFLNGYEAYLENGFAYAAALARINRLSLLSGLTADLDI